MNEMNDLKENMREKFSDELENARLHIPRKHFLGARGVGLGVAARMSAF